MGGAQQNGLWTLDLDMNFDCDKSCVDLVTFKCYQIFSNLTECSMNYLSTLSMV